ncbi:hypothetical protein [Pseudonocardia sp. D17]|uniref:hypothetical protein n=1 Tax=Pseudonocardia sp. D17 TaxID=882661 RepID=UPI0030D00583|nr:hypothetical protein PSD17_43730 [Pseudonocardia sp. D17]
MSSDTDHPRQRTVAELLAENAGSTTGRRRRRREADDPGDGAAPDERGAPRTPAAERYPTDTVAPPAGRSGAPPSPGAARLAGYRGAQGIDRPARAAERAAPERPPVRRPPIAGAATVPEVRPASLTPPAPPTVPEVRPASLAPPAAPAPPPTAPEAWGPEPGRAPQSGPAGAPPARPTPPPRTAGVDAYAPAARRPDEQRTPWVPDRATQQMPRVDRPDRRDPDRRDPDRRDPDRRDPDRRRPGRRDEDTGPIDAPRTGPGSPARRGADDGGPPTVLGAPPIDDTRADGGPPTQAAAFDPDDLDDSDHDDGLDGLTTALPAGGRRAAVDASADEDDPPQATTALRAPEQPTSAMRTPRRPGRDRPAGLDAGDAEDEELDDEPVEAAPQTWAAVIAQWIGGAVVGAGLWVGFAFLWMHLPVVALAAAVLVTVGLVLAVRAMLRDDDLKTTIFAVLVGLLLTVSPAILVLARQQV